MGVKCLFTHLPQTSVHTSPTEDRSHISHKLLFTHLPHKTVHTPPTNVCSHISHTRLFTHLPQTSVHTSPTNVCSHISHRRPFTHLPQTSVHTIWCVTLNFLPLCFARTFLSAFYTKRLKSNSDKHVLDLGHSLQKTCLINVCLSVHYYRFH